ncbi:MAG: aminotransferase class I/II-fold pyridoxal phosphate-dependent enzyme [Gemmatimonadaceae bacterium]
MTMDQSRAPIVESLRSQEKQDSVSFGPPGHESGKGAPDDVKHLLGEQVFKGDLATQKGIDDRLESKRIRQDAERLAAEAWGAAHCFFSTNGTSLSNHVAMLSVARPGDTVLVARNSHKSLISACIVGHVKPVFLEADRDPVWDIEHGISPAELERALDANPDAKAVFVVSPTYFGVTSDIESLSAICHRRGIPLVVDEAWGPHFPFHPEMPKAAIRSGADISVGSIHKTMAGLGQASIMLLQSKLVDLVQFELCYDLFESTSPSVPILATIDASRRQFVHEGKEILEEQLRLARYARAELAKIDGIRVMGKEVIDGKGRFALDETKVLFDISGLGVTGFAAEDWLMSEEQLTFSLSDDRHLLATFMVGTDEHMTKQMLSAVQKMARWARSYEAHDKSRPEKMPERRELGTEMVMSPSDAFFANAEHVPLERAVGRIAAQMVSPYPPGIPRLLPGQKISAVHVAFLRESLEAGAFMMDASIANEGKIRVVA